MRIARFHVGLMFAVLGACQLVQHAARADEAQVLPPVTQRFAADDVEEVPSFQRHVVPLFGRLGCNGRACHGSFQGRGGFRLSLFGYDFASDHAALLDPESPRVDLQEHSDSLILNKPTSEDEHEGGQRYRQGGWEYQLFRQWIEGGGQFDKKQVEKLATLQVTPAEIVFQEDGQQVQLQAVAVWEDGSREDVTPLCRFQTNNEQHAKIDINGVVTSAQPGDTHVVVFYDNAVFPVPVIRPVSDKVAGQYPSVETPHEIDKLVVAKLSKLGIVPSELSSDAEFLRRVCLDLTGTLPAPQEVEDFLADTSADKRARKIDQLLESDAYAAWWTTKLCDYTGNNSDQLVNVVPLNDRGRAGRDWYQWIYQRVADNVPYDELAAGIITATSRQAEQDYIQYSEMMSEIYRDDSAKSYADLDSMPHYWARRDFRQPQERAIGFAYAFMGIRIQCAQCHKHPFDQWSKQDFEQFTRFFSGVQFSNTGVRRDSREDREQYDQLIKELGLKGKRGNEVRRAAARLLEQGKTVPFPEVYVVKPAAPRGNARTRSRTSPPSPPTAKLLGGDLVTLSDHEDARLPLMEWLRDKDNRFFAPAFVNRVWASYFNVGIVEPADDLSLANPPSNKPLLEYLTRGFIESGFDMKWLHREIANSRTYQLSWKPNDTNITDQRNFSRAIPRRLPAEVVYDAVRQATAADDQVAQCRTNLEDRAIAIPSSGQRNRSNSQAAYALTVFGRSTRESNCDCDRSSEPNLLQTVYLQNDRDVLSMIDRRRDGWLDQVARQLGHPGGLGAPSPALKRPDNYEQMYARLEARIRQLKKKGSRQEAKRLQQRLAQLQQRFGTPKEEPDSDQAQQANADLGEVVKQAYLRTLSRYPSEQERERSLQYINQSEDKVSGVRGLLWALVNTKEFIVNH